MAEWKGQPFICIVHMHVHISVHMLSGLLFVLKFGTRYQYEASRASNFAANEFSLYKEWSLQNRVHK